MQGQRLLTPCCPPDPRNPELALTPPFRSDSPVLATAPAPSAAAGTRDRDLATDPELEKKLLHHLADLGLALPTDAVAICLAISTVRSAARSPSPPAALGFPPPPPLTPLPGVGMRVLVPLL